MKNKKKKLVALDRVAPNRPVDVLKEPFLVVILTIFSNLTFFRCFVLVLADPVQIVAPMHCMQTKIIVAVYPFLFRQLTSIINGAVVGK